MSLYTCRVVLALHGSPQDTRAHACAVMHAHESGQSMAAGETTSRHEPFHLPPFPLRATIALSVFHINHISCYYIRTRAHARTYTRREGERETDRQT